MRSQDLERVSRKVVSAACAIVLLHTALVFAGWAFRDRWLINFPFASRYSTMPLTAVGLLLCALVLWLRRSDEAVTAERRRTAWFLSALVVLLGALVLWEYAFDQDPGIDRLLFPESVTALLQTFPGRPPLATALALVAVGVALACLDVKSRAVQVMCELLMLIMVLIALERCVGYLYREIGISPPRWRWVGHPVFRPMSAGAAVCFIALSLGILYARPQRRNSPLGLFHTPGPARLLARWMIPATIVAPLLFGWLGILVFRSGLRGTIYPFSLVVSGMIVLLLVATILSARAIQRADQERADAEDALADRERLQHAVLDNAGVGILVLDADGRRVTANKTFENMVGYTAAALSALPTWSFIHAADAEQNQRLFQELIRGHRDGYFMELRCTRSDGTQFWGELNTSIAKDQAGNAEYIIAMLQNVTPRKEAEDARRRLTAIIEATTDFVGIADPQGKAIYVNEAGRRLTGIHPEEIPRLTIFDFHSPESGQRVMREGVPAAKRDGVWTGETELRCRDGRIIPVSQVILAHKAPDGEAAYLSTVMRDITYRKRLELAQQFLLDVSRASSGSMDTSTILRSLVGLVVPRHADYCAIHLLAPDGSIEKAAFARRARGTTRKVELLRVYPNKRKPSPLIAQIASSGEATIVPMVKDQHLKLLLRDPRHITLLRKVGMRSFLALPLRGRERVLGVLFYMRNETDKPFEGHRIALAQEMAARVALSLENAELLKQAREATRIRDELLRVVAHDLRSPLNTISLTADYLRTRRITADSKWSGKLDVVIRSVAQADALIQDLLDVARMEAGKLSVDLQPTPVHELIAEAIELHEQLAAERGMRLHSTVPAELGQVQADRSRLLQVFSNLIGNAIKFSPAGSAVVLDANRRDGVIRFAVRDQGPGISQTDQQHLFNPFWQARKGKAGAGLGLAITKAIVQAHGGRIWVESAPGAGSTFFFTLRLAPPAPDQSIAAD